MLSKYFEIKTESESFKQNLENIFNKYRDKRVLLYGAGQGFFALNKTYRIKDKLNIVAIADKKFVSSKADITGLKQIEPKDILNEEFDVILITNEISKSIKKYLTNTLEINDDKIAQIFVEEIPDEAVNLNYLYKHKFNKTLPKLIKKLQGKQVLIYGAGIYFELIQKYFDLSGLNIVGISDKKFEMKDAKESFLGYKTFLPCEIVKLKPDYVLVATKFYIALIENLYYNTLKNSGIKIKPLVRKSLWTLLKEIWN